MNSMTPHEDEVLARALRGQVDGLTEAPLTVDDIAGKARRIRRNRRIAGVVGGVAVAAMALPAGLMSGSVLDRSDAPPVLTQGPSPTQAVEPTPSPALEPVPGELAFSIADLPTGEPPQVGWLEDGVAYLSDGSDIVLPPLDGRDARTVTELGANLLLGAWDDQGDVEVVVVTRDGEILSADPAAGSPVLSDDGTVAAYTRPDGTPVLLTGDGLEVTELPAAPAETPTISAVVGSAPCADDCTVWVTDVGRKLATFRVDADGATEVTTVSRVRAVQGDRYLGNISIRDDLFPVDGLFTFGSDEPEWTAEALVGFSPDGRWVVSQFAEGLGSSELLILDAETGEPQVTWRRTTAEGATGLGWPVWEDDTHLLQVLTQGRDVAIVRFGLDGSAELTGVRQTVDDPIDATLSLLDR